MASKSKDVRIEQLRIFEKKLALRLEQLDAKGSSKEKAQNDPLVKSLKSKIRETNVRIAAFDKFVQKKEELAKAKVQKLADLEKKEEESKSAPAKKESAVEEKQAEPKSKKKTATADKEPKKQQAVKDEAVVKETSKPVAADEAAPKKAKKRSDAADGEAPKKKASKKKEE